MSEKDRPVNYVLRNDRRDQNPHETRKYTVKMHNFSMLQQVI
jgi:hypothetical protein